MSRWRYAEGIEYREKVLPYLREVRDAFPGPLLDEQAVPSYLSGYWLSRRIFWRRIYAVMQELGPTKGDICVDFGCGTGLMLPFLAQRYKYVYAVDTFAEVASRFYGLYLHNEVPPDGRVSIVRTIESTQVEPLSIDLVLALDVLEHVGDLDEVLESIKTLMKPTGRLIISGPTENTLYKIGRKVVGFSGHYHQRNVYDIEKAARRMFRVRRLGYFPFRYGATLFLLLGAEK